VIGMDEINLFKPNITEETIQEVSKVLRSGWIGLGPKTKEFEQKFANYVGAKYCIALNSCTSALHLAIKLLDLQQNDEVITTPMTFVSTNEVILYERLIPKFVDVEYGTLNIDIGEVEKAITRKTKAIMCVHYSGQPCDLDEIYELANQHGLRVIEDAAHACGASYKGRRLGSADLACWSFHAVKNLPIGDGGAITFNDEKYYKKLLKLRWMGINKDTWSRSSDNPGVYAWRYDVNELGYKYHMNDIAATIGLGQLEVLDKHNATRKKFVDMYLSNIRNDKVIFQVHKQGRVSSNHTFHIKIENRDRLMEVLHQNGINCGVHYIPNHMFNLFGWTQSLPIVERAYGQIINLPLHTLLSDEDIYKVCEVINKF
jgi:perosamine synthetase